MVTKRAYSLETRRLRYLICPYLPDEEVAGEISQRERSFFAFVALSAARPSQRISRDPCALRPNLAVGLPFIGGGKEPT